MNLAKRIKQKVTVYHYCPVCGYKCKTWQSGNVSLRMNCGKCYEFNEVSILMLIEKIV